MSVKTRISIRVDLEDEWPDRLRKIRRYLGLKSNAEVIRLLIMEKYREIEEQIEKKKDNP